MKKIITNIFAKLALVAGLATAFTVSALADTVTLVSGSGTSGYTVPTGWTTSGTIEGGSYLKFDNGTITSPEFAPHSGLSFTYSVATFGSGTNHPLTIRILNASTNAVISEQTTSTPTSSSYITTGSPLSLGDVSVAFKIQLYAPTGKGIRLRNYSITGTPSSSGSNDSDLAITGAPVALSFDLYNNSSAQTVSFTSSSSGSVTVSTSEYVQTSISGKTITVTPLKVTPSAQTITVNQAADDTYAAGAATFTVYVTDSAPTYNVTYKANGGTGNDIVLSHKEGVEVTIEENSFSYAGHRFTKWNTENGGSGADYLPGDIISNIQADVDLYAQWEESNETTYDFTSIDGFDSWGNSYSSHSVTYSDATVTFDSANHQTSTITDRPVTKGQPVSLVLTDGSTMSSATFVCTQWGTKAQTITLYYSTDGGDNYTSTEVTSTNFTITKSNLPEGTNAVKITFSNSDNQVGIASASIEKVASSDPSISVDPVAINVGYAASEGVITVTPSNINTPDLEVVFYESDGTTPASYGWVSASINSSNNVAYSINVNDGDERKAYLKVHQKNSEVYSALVTITQAAAPVIYTSIAALYEAATTADASVLVTFNDWIVSGVSTNGKNVFVTDNSGNGFVIYSNSDQSGTYSVGNILSGTAVSCTVKKNFSYAQVTSLSANDLTISSGGLVTASEIALASLSGVNTGALVSYEGLTCSEDNSKYYLSDGTTTIQLYNSLYAFSGLESGKKYNITGVYQQYNTTKEILPRSADDIEEYVSAEPSITVAHATVNAPANGASGTITVTYNNITTVAAKVVFYTSSAATDPATAPAWITAEINTDNNLEYLIEENTTEEVRAAYLKVWAYDDNENEVYSDIITINQAIPVIDYATLPFSFDGGRADIESTNGLTQDGLDSDYGSSPKLKFNGAGDYVILKINAQPGTLTFDIKNNSFSGGTFKVQTSEDGSAYTDLETYTEISGTQNEEFNNLGENVRYIKWVYTEKSSGNVGLGNITLAEYVAPSSDPSITVTPNTASPAAGDVSKSLTLTYENLEISDASDFAVQFCDAQGAALTAGDEPSWIVADVEEQNSGYVVSIVMNANEGAERSAYFKVYALGNTDYVYSNLVTITQAEYVADYAGLPFEYDGNGLGELPLGFTQSGLTDKYNSSPKMKFDGTGDYAILKINEAPGTLTFDILGNSFSGGTFKVQTSANGVSYTDLATYTELGTVQSEEFSNFTTNVRYIKWVYTEKVNGNVGIGNISLTKAEAAPDIINLAATSNGNGYWVSFYNGAGRYELPDGAQAFTLDSEYKLYRLGDGKVIPEGVAVILIADKANITLKKSDKTGVVAVSGKDNESILLGSDSPKDKESGKLYYVLGIKDNIVGFYKYNGVRIPTGKAYYTVNVSE